MDAMTFFQNSAGTWRSQRATHHLAFRRAETGSSEIFVDPLGADDPRVIEICQLHSVDPAASVGGAFLRWQGVMAWDKEDENHEGTTVFALIPDAHNPRQGALLRERGYAEIVPIAGRYQIEPDGALLLITEYETMTTLERFWFPSPNLRVRTSTVQRFGGFNTATFCAEVREEAAGETGAVTETGAEYDALVGW
jgi:hypothetical protein